MLSLVNKVTKSFRLLRWSTICAILFYMFFIGLILHSTTTKLQHSLKSSSSSSGSSGNSHYQHAATSVESFLPSSSNKQHLQHSSGNYMKKPEDGLADTLQNMRFNKLQGKLYRLVVAYNNISKILAAVFFYGHLIMKVLM